ncbi:hypothetical protein VTK26DRAFT_1640 [Humicola hyalothermophila]
MEIRQPAGLLPEGFFANTEEIYAEVASYPVLPPEKIKQYWNAYTTTFRRLFDPSAFRLENFWWHVWGSDKRYLSGPALAKLFREFSDGPTFAPLRRPVHDGVDSVMLGSGRPSHEGTKPEKAQHSQQTPEQDAASSESAKPPTPSSSRPQALHPILKKSRRPSSGRRPTARFASPPASGDQEVDEGNPPSPQKPAASKDMPPPPLPPLQKRKKPATSATTTPKTTATSPLLPEPDQGCVASAASGGQARSTTQATSAKSTRGAIVGGRRIVVSSAASRRKPRVLRRLSSQSSGSDHDQRGTGPATVGAAKHGGNRRRPSSTAPQLPQGSVSPQTGDLGLSAKAAGKRPAGLAAGKDTKPPNPADHSDERSTQQLPASGPQRRPTDSVAAPGVGPKPPEAPQRPQQSRPPVAGFVADSEFANRAPRMIRSRSNNTEGQARHREPGVALLPSRPTSSVAMFTTTAHGQFDSETVTANPVVPEARDIPDSVAFASQPSPSSPLADLPFKPTPPGPAAPIAFGRSRSELALLLQRERSRAGQGS